MRIIKFRGKHKGKWLYGNIIAPTKENDKYYIFNEGCWKYEIESNTLCQFMGISDCTGTEIYENDILSWIETYNIGHTERCYGAVIWDDKQKRFAILMDRHFVEGHLIEHFTMFQRKMCLKVIGNIIDTPDFFKRIV